MKHKISKAKFRFATTLISIFLIIDCAALTTKDSKSCVHSIETDFNYILCQHHIADKEYKLESFTAMKRVYLHNNITNGKNVLTQDMISMLNTIYIIQHNYDLNGTKIIIPKGCVLDFQGGSINNGIISGNNTKTINFTSNCTLDGLFTEKYTLFINSSNGTNDTKHINNIINHFIDSKISFKNDIYLIDGDYNTSLHCGLNFTNTNIYLFNGCIFKQINLNDSSSKIIRIDAKNIIFENFRLIGDINTHESTGGTDEWNYGIQLTGDCNNLVFQNIRIEDFSGDCMNLIANNGENIVVQHCEFKGARRGCISIESIKNLTIQNCSFVKNNDIFTFPDFYIDIEPLVQYNNTVKGVKIINNHFYSEKQIHIGILLQATAKGNVTDINISNNLFDGNPPINGYLNFPSSYINGKSIICNSNILKVTSSDYPLNQDLGELLNISGGANITFNDLHIEGLISRTRGIRVWGKNTSAILNNCKIINCEIYIGGVPGYLTTDIPKVTLNNCDINYNISTASLVLPVYSYFMEIHSSRIKTKGSISIGNGFVTFSGCTIESSQGSTINCSLIQSDLSYEEGKIGLNIDNCKIINNSSETAITGNPCLSVRIKKSCIFSKSKILTLTTNKRNETYYDDLIIENSDLYSDIDSSTKYTNSLINLNAKIISTSFYTKGGKILYFGSQSHICNSISFINCNFQGIIFEKTPVYSNNYSKVSFKNVVVNGSLIKDNHFQ